MATYTAAAAQASVNPKSLRVGLVAVTSVFSPGAGQSISAGDTIQMLKVPANATVVFLGLKSTYADCVGEVGDGLDDDRYINAQSFSAAHASSMFAPGVAAGGANAVAPYTYSTDDTIDIKVTLASITTIAGAFYLTAILSMDPDLH